jgi:hypothetical protein
MDMRFGAWNIGVCIGWAPNDSVEGGREVRWECSGTAPAGEYTFFYGKENEKHELGPGFLYLRESYQQLRELSLLVIGCHT